MKAKIYHNPRCSKSRTALALLEQHGLACEVVNYLDQPPTRAELEALLKKLELPPQALVRTQDAAFAASGLTPDAEAGALLDLLEQTPALLQRPIVVIGNRARIGRPPEQILDLLR